MYKKCNLTRKEKQALNKRYNFEQLEKMLTEVNEQLIRSNEQLLNKAVKTQKGL